MGRDVRSHLPGAVFHLTARTQGREPWFTGPVRSTIIGYLARVFGVGDSTLLAYAIMPNHLHLVVQQGREPLGRVMQPLLRRTALLVQRFHRVEGHVFERRFSDRPCLDPEYLRNAIVYVHLNPVRAGLAAQPGSYRWTSHDAYARVNGGALALRGVLAPEDGLRLFACVSEASDGQLRSAYRDFLGWRMERDRESAERPKKGDPGSPAATGSATARLRIPLSQSPGCWSASLSPLFAAPPSRGGAAPPLDLQEIARQTIAAHAPGLSLELVRSAYKGREAVRVRRLVIQRMARSGHRGKAIARYLRVSPQCVSNVVVAARQQAVDP